MNWISVKDRLPDDHQTVLTFEQWHGIRIATYTYTREKPWTFDTSVADLDWVTHWMPLPEPPGKQ